MNADQCVLLCSGCAGCSGTGWGQCPALCRGEAAAAGAGEWPGHHGLIPGDVPAWAGMDGLSSCMHSRAAEQGKLGSWNLCY